ncbi:betaine/proline/choline family ABC transporter ATP-binding protein [Streptococcus pseudoporcinus]|uniref:Quaternary amine transport ATP-binding protein n=1 Tax=Streptococcus pseudoporcinus TaxID=361101 RepID=A0A4U9XJQ9_9STRE|nr:betaine/proline/choline family ABC transporter ATP-binding protein [Streptococcus pseudoporcinus]VTS12501.1 Osmotically activated L-carnitine/choline ABC transporter, ATP-binding protein OpuCA [Streptococcus pseudoporcinus]VUC65064.1 Osmotically activated L-carnitine/choline ABC transporter, ATP-binding protein OpuCA [Streptococcus pseudoporcinus]VUC95785.1 Osmotically activated L-carnitine/choline ABC transporter, ATP-binding protein OpuCA [Streptococcus pseudoporcinus]VUC96178.1 Osmoticall
METPIIEYQNVNKIYGDKIAVDKINLKIMPGDFICFIGTSGSGKTTLMRMINRMLKPSNGKILFKGKDISEFNPVQLRRKIGYVIQSIGLMPHMTIYENITLVPKLLKWSEEDKMAKAKELLKIVELPEDFLDRYPSELSGGQQQRIGVIRALAADQDIILMDEPFGALDPITREGIQDLVKSLQEKMGKTIILVTHDMDEALKLATKIVVMDNGKMVQEASPTALLQKPATEFVEKMIGEERLMRAQSNITPVKSIMLPNPVSITAEKTLSEAISLMRQKRVDSLLVTEDDSLIGLIDLESLSNRYQKDLLVSDLMTQITFSVQEDALLRDTAQRIFKRGLKYAPVVDKDNKLKGVITRSSLVDILYNFIWGGEDKEEAND